MYTTIGTSEIDTIDKNVGKSIYSKNKHKNKNKNKDKNNKMTEPPTHC